ncbi:DUF2505 domain-containing protein [Boudabousia marimammalium]|uniref:DUF2505 domain-containing protein n=1 Tax=Boudabousia marimammalium TaxID=156892 RepID=A0A1Q5PLV0_9ACTO|nr:DUF2505 domain-containing protein [Boudabousia marimammalium]OKL48045.1 hypothetical protein BM477_06135 [Boudabousia marimammalium]
MDLSAAFTYPASLSQVHEMLLDPHYRTVRAEGRAVDSQVESESASGDVTLLSTLPLPPEMQTGPAAKVLGGAESISVRETVGPIEDDAFSYEVASSSRGIPVSGGLQCELRAEGEGVAVTVSGSVKVDVFLIGPMIESAIAGKTNQAVERELEAAKRYLAG